MTAPSEWFREWFGDAYLSLYPHRDEDEAEAGVELFVEDGAPAEGARILDLACGAGRHLQRLRARGFEATGMDLSAALLAEARKRPRVRGSLVRGDMRALPFADGAFGGLVNFFTSFGYFTSRGEDLAVIDEVRRVLSPGAPFIMDYLNAPWVMERLEPETVSEIQGKRVRQVRWVEDGQVFKRIEIREGDAGPEVYHERVRLYEPDDLERILAERGLRSEARFGGYHGEHFGDGSPRLILRGRAT
ncbi:MAG: methyltransferase domain-containing protein [Gemmatimonadota bacterium]|nr:methyltransferase domain-containing protein [Gemmatimonadota bacterium]